MFILVYNLFFSILFTFCFLCTVLSFLVRISIIAYQDILVFTRRPFELVTDLIQQRLRRTFCTEVYKFELKANAWPLSNLISFTFVDDRPLLIHRIDSLYCPCPGCVRHLSNFMMIPRPCFWGRILVLITSLLVSNASDPCGSYKSLDNPYRSTGYVAREGIDPMICDYDLQTGWYRFVSKVGGKMPETKVGRGHCGTIALIWMRGQHPSNAEGTVDRTACVNFNNLYGGCIPIAIKVRNCTDFFVYRLVAPYGCHMAYCAGMP